MLARARGEGLEAGVFISYGPPPLIVTIEDEVFGQNRVAIADKINESARGTARAAPARARADARLAHERTARRNPRLQHAWSVFIGQPLTLTIGPEVEDLAVAALRAGDPKGGMKVLARPVRAALETAARDPQERTGDIYNNGAALSEEALRAFLEEVRGRRVVRRVELAPDAGAGGAARRLVLRRPAADPGGLLPPRRRAGRALPPGGARRLQGARRA